MKRNFVMGLFAGLIGAGMLLIVLSATGIVGARGVDVRSDVARTNEVSATSIVTSTFTYQGQLINSGSPVSSTCDFQFGLYDALNNSNRIGITQTVSSVSVTRGLFTALLNAGNEFGNTAFNGDARWLSIAVACPSGSGYTPLSPRQQLTSLPFALPGLRTLPNATSPNIIGGYSGNFISSTVVGGVIGGGGESGYPNRVQADYGTVSGGEQNTASNYAATIGGGAGNTASQGYATVGGGQDNTANGNNSTIGGGYNNTVGYYATVGGGEGNIANNDYASISGGYYNTASGRSAFVGGGGYDGNNYSGNHATGNASTIGGGLGNTASGKGAFVGGGGYDGTTIAGNQATGNASTIGGGLSNLASGGSATIGGGISNTASGNGASVSGGYNRASNWYATVAGGDSNNAGGDHATIGGGGFNTAGGYYATVGGGNNNNAGGERATIGGGRDNIASGLYAAIPGGLLNTATGNYSFAAGRRAKALHPGAFVWGDSTDADIASTGINQFLVRASGGIYLYPTSGSCILSTGAGGWACSSDRNLKENFKVVDGQAVLQNLSRIPISRWNSIGQDTTIQHIGPMAQDFYAAFNLGEDNLHINTVDAQGVALAAIQGLYQENQDLKSQNADLTARVSKLEQNKTASNSPAQAEPFNVSTLLSAMALILAGGMWLQQRRSKRGQV